MKWMEDMACYNTVHATLIKPKAILAPKCTLILPTTCTQSKLARFTKTICANDFVHEFLFILKPFTNWVSLGY